MFILKYKIVSNDFDDVVFVDSIHSLMIYKAFKKGKNISTLYLLGCNLCNDYIFDKLENVVVIDVNIKLNIIERLLINNFDVYPTTLSLLKNLIKNRSCYYIQDHLYLYPIFRNKQVNILEDGVVNYLHVNKFLFFKDRLRAFFNIEHFPYGYNKNVRNVLLTGLLDIPNELVDRAIVISKDNISQVIHDFIPESMKIVIGSDIGDFDLLITQPLSEDLLCSEDEKISIYRQLIEKSKRLVIIKPHPREQTDYNSLFENLDVMVFDSKKVIESLYKDIRLINVISLFSTATYFFKPEHHIKLYGMDGFNNLLNSLRS